MPHVKENILYCFLNNQKDELAYWLAEYYTSGYEKECLDYITRIYYIYYAILYPSFEKLLTLKRKQWNNDPDYIFIAFIAHNLRTKQPCYDIHNIIQCPKPKRGRKPTLTTILKKREWTSLYMLLKQADLFECHTNICLYYDKTVDLVPIQDYYKETTELLSVHNQLIMILGAAIHLTIKEKYIHSNSTVIILGKTLQKKYIELNTEIPRKFLEMNILYPSRQLIPESSFRNMIDHWSMYAYDNPLWKSRIEKHHGTLKHKQLVFETDDDLETFYETYGYELDEQSLELQQKIYPFVHINEENS